MNLWCELLLFMKFCYSLVKIVSWWFCTGLTDGIIRTYDLFTAYNPGYFQLEILACDFAGHSTTTNVNIYILRDDQRVKIVFNEIPDLVRENQDDFVNLLSNITGAIVNLDDIQVGLLTLKSYFRLFFFFCWTVNIFVNSSMWTRKAESITLRPTCSSTSSIIKPTPFLMLRGNWGSEATLITCKLQTRSNAS